MTIEEQGADYLSDIFIINNIHLLCDIMVTKVSELTIDELRDLISHTVKDSVEDALEDLLALQSEEYIESIEEARKDYKEGKTKSFEELFG